MYLHARHSHAPSDAGDKLSSCDDCDKQKPHCSFASVIPSMGYNILIGCFVLALLVIYLFHGSTDNAITRHPFIRRSGFEDAVAKDSVVSNSPIDPAITPTLPNFRSVLNQLLTVGVRDGIALATLLSSNPLHLPATPEEFTCPHTSQLFDFPLTVDRLRAEAFRNGSEGSWIFYQHLRKAGGTGFCELARSNLGRTLTPHYYCMIDNRGSLATPPWNDPQYLLQQLRAKKHRITANEWDVFYSSMLSLDGAVFGTTLRHPVDRIYSQYRFEHLEHRDGSQQGAPRNPFITWYNNNKQWNMGANYYIKTFIGTEDTKIPAAGTGDFYWTYHKFNGKPLTATDFYQALTVLRKFHLILITEWLDSSPAMLRNVLDWQAAPKKVLPHQSQAGRNSSMIHVPSFQLIPPEDYERVLGENALDWLFFQCVQRIYLERLHKCN